MKRIVLVALNAKYIHSNLAVFSLRAFAAERGIPVEIREFTINQTKDEIMQGIFREKPDVLCFSCYIWNISFVRELIADLHKVLPGTVIWVGGPEVSFDSVKVLQENPGVFGVMRGEGEKTFSELAEFYGRQEESEEKRTAGGAKELRRMKGITFREEDGEIFVGFDREAMDLSEIPFPYGDLEDFENRIIYYESSRGCPFSCSYCLSSVDKKLRFRRLELVKRELQFFIDRKVKQVKFVDRTFNCRREHSMEIWRYLAEHDNGVTNFHFEIAADLLGQEEMELFQKMRPGLIQLEIGVQSTNPRTIREIHRKMDFSKVRQAVEKVQEGRNIHQHLDLIAGLPFEDYDSFARSFGDVYSLHPQQLQLGFLKVLKGSYMQRHMEEYGGIYSGKEPYEVLATHWLSYEEVLQLKQVEDMVEVYYNSGQFQEMLQEIEKHYDNMFFFFEGLGAFYRKRGYQGMSHNRIRRYEILLEYLETRYPAETDKFRELAVLDVYARENAKSRPDFATDLSVYKESFRKFYQSEQENRGILSGYEEYDWKQMMKMTHLEVVSQMEGRRAYLFDYQKRDPLTGSALRFEVELPQSV